MIFIIVLLLCLEEIQSCYDGKHGNKHIDIAEDFKSGYNERYNGRLTIKSKACIFPFSYRGLEYMDCAPGINQPSTWCAISTKDDYANSVKDWDICAQLYTKTTCASLSCPSNGRCDEESGTREATCVCNDGYRSQGSRCIAMCGSLSCPSNGRCTEGSGTSEATCVCNNGYRSQGSRCIDECTPGCQRGSCNGPNKCGCTPGWGTDRCNKEFYEAASAGELSFIKGELSTGNSSTHRLNWRNKDFIMFTALHIATYMDHAPVVRAMMEAGASTFMESDKGLTPVYIAARDGRFEVLRILLEPKYRADVNLQSEYGGTPVYAAAGKGQTAALELLISRGGNVNKMKKDGSSPLGIASVRGHVGVVRALLNAGANIGYVKPSSGYTALHYAAWKNHADIARLLLQNSADKTKKNKMGNTAADMSRIHGDGSVAKIIGN